MTVEKIRLLGALGRSVLSGNIKLSRAKLLILWAACSIVLMGLLTLYCFAHGLIYEPQSSNLARSFYWAAEVLWFWTILVPLLFWWTGEFSNRIKGNSLRFTLISAAILVRLSGLVIQALLWQLSAHQTLAFAFRFLPVALALCFITILLALNLKQNSNTNVAKLQTPDTNMTLRVFSGAEEVSLDLKQVSVVISAGNYIELEVSGKHYLRRQTLKAFFNWSAPYGFIRIHRCYVVNIDNIRSVISMRSQTPILVMNDGRKIPVGRVYRSVLLEIFDSRSFIKLETNCFASRSSQN